MDSTTKPAEPLSLPTGTVTFLFTDIEGSTKLLDRLRGDYATLLSDQRDLFRASFGRWNGVEIDTQGDSFFVAFPRAADALACAAESQLLLSNHAWPKDVEVRVRMGLHTGEPVLMRTGYVGMDVHRAARIGAAGHGGQILLSAITRELVGDELPAGSKLVDLGEHRLKDVGTIRLYQLTVPSLLDSFPPLKTLETGDEPPAPGESPFMGLQHYDETDAHLFFGREAITARLVDRVRSEPFLAIVGASGSGKSSIARAGLVPGIRDAQGPWRIAVFTPGERPLEALAIALTSERTSVADTATLVDDLRREPRSLHLAAVRLLAAGRPRDAGRLLLVVDQFEEVFTLARDAAERDAFISNLMAAAGTSGGPLHIVITLRADFYSHLAAYDELRDAVATKQEYIGPMSAEELRRAIERPATEGGWEFAPGLIDLVFRDVGSEPGALPLLSHALLETWHRRRGTSMTLKGYGESGGVHGGIARTADRVFNAELDANEREIARGIFLRLTELGEGTQDTRRRVDLRELLPEDAERSTAVRAVLQRLADRRLVTISESSVEVAHEALIREWPLLREWLGEDREGLRRHRALTEAADEWLLLDRDDGALYRGVRLAQASEWATAHPSVLNDQEGEFLRASHALAERVEAESAEQRRRELDNAEELAASEAAAARRLRRRAVFLSGALAVAAALAVVAVVLAQRAGDQARIAEARELYASAIAVLDNDPELSILLTLEGAALEVPTADAVTNLHAAVQASRSLLHVQLDETAIHPINLGVALAPDGKTLFVSPDSASIQVWDVDSHRLLRTLGAPRVNEHADRSDVAMSPDGSRVAIVGQEGVIHVWNVQDGAEQELQGPGAPAGWPAFSPDGHALAVLTFNEATPDPVAEFGLSVWDLDTGSTVQSWPWDVPATVVFHPDGNRLLVTDCVCSPERTLLLLDILTGQRTTAVGQVEGIFDSRPTAAQISPDGTSIATVGSDGIVSIWDATDGALIRSFGDLRDAASSAAFSPDGTRLAITGQNSTTRIWDPASGDLLRVLAGQGGNPGSAWFSADGSRIATGSSNLTARVWDLSQTRVGEVAGYALGPGFAQIVDVDHRGQIVAVLGRSCPSFCLGHAAIVDLVTGDRMDLIDQAGAAIALSPDATGVVSQAGFAIEGGGTATGPVRMYRLWSGEVAFELEGICPYAVRGIPACGDAPDVPWDDQAGSLAFSSDSSLLAMRGGSGALATWDAMSGRLIEVLGTSTSVYLAGPAVSPDGAVVAAWKASTDNTRVVLLGSRSLSEVDGFDLIDADRLQFAPDGMSLAVASRSIDTQIYAAGAWNLQHRLPVQSHDFDFNGAGLRLVTADTDGFIRLWDVESGTELEAMPVDRTGIGNQVGRVSFLDDERHVLTVDRGVLLVMTLDTEELLEIARSRVTRSLTDAECQKYLREACPSP